jgi:hypothetical protein
MIHNVSHGPDIYKNTEHSSQKNEGRKVLKYKTNDRMAGSVPVWEKEDHNTSSTAKSSLKASHRLYNETIRVDYNAEEFGFSDLVDIVNPLHHIPVIGDIYRSATGDSIQAPSRLMGGILFGGVSGGGTALANIIIEEETGTDIAGNMIGFATGTRINTKEISPKETIDNPEIKLSNAVRALENNNTQEIPGTALSFVDLGFSKRRIYEKVYDEESRMAGSMVRVRDEVLHDGPNNREPITKVQLSNRFNID